MLEGKPYLISSFRYTNLVIFCDGFLTFVYGFVNNDGIAEYTRSIKVILSPRIPTDIKITFMSVVNDGSLVVLSGMNSLFIVRVWADLWASSADGHVPLGQYFCGVEQVHPTLFASPRAPKSLRIRWINSNSINSSAQLLTVLFDDNRIRIYHADNVCDVPYMVIDYCSFMCTTDLPYEGYGSNSYGFYKCITSFDCIASCDECPTIIAIDSEGEMYSTTVNINSNSASPWTRPLIPPSSLPCDPVDIRIVDHPMNDLFSVFAVLSAENVISFVVAIPDEQSGHSLFLHEQLQLSKGSTWSLCASDFAFTILVANDATVLHIDLSPWLQKFSMILDKPSSDTCAFSISENSVVHELISLSDYEADGFSAPCSCSQERVLGLICKSTNPRETTTMFIACSMNPPLLTAFLKLQVRDPQLNSHEASVVAEGVGLPLNEKVLNTILSNKKNLLPVRMASSQQQLLKNLLDFFDVANKNQVVMRAALDMSHDRITELVKFADQLTDKQNAINHRLLQVFRQTVAIKENMEKIRSNVTKTFARVDKVSTHLTGSHELTIDETELLTVLKQYRSKMLTNAMNISKLSLEAAELQREIKGPARAFTASPVANMFVLKHSEEELSALKRRLDVVSAWIEEYSSRRVTENDKEIQC